MKSFSVRTAVCLLTLTLLLSFPSCSLLFPESELFGNVIHDEGLDAYRADFSDRGLTACLFPSEDFILKYMYIGGNYHYYDNFFVNEDALELCIAYMTYDATVYGEAKQYCQENMALSTADTKEYGGYTFVENIGLTEELKSEEGKALAYPRYFCMFGYNDASNRLMFIGLYCGDSYKKDAALAERDFGKFLEEFFGEYYDFEVKE